MIWAFAVVTVSLFAIIIQMLIVYQKKAYDLRTRQNPLRKKIKDHVQSLQESTGKIRRTAGERITELEIAHPRWADEIGPLKDELKQLEKSMPPAPEPVVESDEEDGEVPPEDAEVIRNRELFTEANNTLRELDNNLSGIERDTKLAKRTLEQMETKIKQLPAARRRG